MAECRALGAEVTLVDGLITDCGRVAAEGVRRFGRFDVSTLKEPYRIEGKKTMGYELAEQMGWTLPDVIIYPTGGGTGLIGMWKAFDEMEAVGLDRAGAAAHGHRPVGRLRADGPGLPRGPGVCRSPGRGPRPSPTGCACRLPSAIF